MLLKKSCTMSKQMINRLKIVKVRVKLIGAVSVLIFGISVIICIIFPNRLQKELMKATALKADQIGEIIAYETAPVLDNEDQDAMRDIVDAVMQNSELHRIKVARSDSSVFIEYHHKLESEGKNCDQHLYTIQKPLRVNDQPVGTLWLSYTLEPVRQKVAVALLHSAILSVCIFFLGGFSVFLITRVFAVPFNKMLETVERIANGDSGARANIRTDDEIGFLAREFDIMLDRLMAAYKRLDSLNQELEIKIESRTAALRLSNAQLKAELKERKQVERELSAERVRLMATLSKIEEGVITTDVENNINTINQVAANITGWNEVDAIGKPIMEVFKLPVSADNGENVHDIQEFIQYLDKQENGSFITIVDSKAREKQLDISIIPIHSLYGDKIGTVFIFQPRHNPQHRDQPDLKKYQA